MSVATLSQQRPQRSPMDFKLELGPQGALPPRQSGFWWSVEMQAPQAEPGRGGPGKPVPQPLGVLGPPRVSAWLVLRQAGSCKLITSECLPPAFLNVPPQESEDSAGPVTQDSSLSRPSGGRSSEL